MIIRESSLPGKLTQFDKILFPVRATDSVANLYMGMSGVIMWETADWPTGGDWHSLLGELRLEAHFEPADVLMDSSATVFIAAVNRFENTILVSDDWGAEQGIPFHTGPNMVRIDQQKLVLEFDARTYGSAAIPKISFWVDLLLFRPTLLTPPAPQQQRALVEPVSHRRGREHSVVLRADRARSGGASERTERPTHGAEE